MAWRPPAGGGHEATGCGDDVMECWRVFGWMGRKYKSNVVRHRFAKNNRACHRFGDYPLICFMGIDCQVAIEPNIRLRKVSKADGIIVMMLANPAP
jgi:hypothetical protein